MRDLRYRALSALMIAVACGGGDPPGGGNEDTDGGDTMDGRTGNGGRTDGYVPNPNKPLVEAIPGMWRLVFWSGGNVPPELADPFDVSVDPTDPACERAYREPEMAAGNDPSWLTILHEPGDACIWNLIPSAIVLGEESESVWLDYTYDYGGDGTTNHIVVVDGTILNGGTRIRYRYQSNADSGPPPFEYEYEKIE